VDYFHHITGATRSKTIRSSPSRKTDKTLMTRYAVAHGHANWGLCDPYTEFKNFVLGRRASVMLFSVVVGVLRRIERQGGFRGD
jgi:hypothetical protein